MNSSNKYKVLIIEDEANILSLLSTILETGGYQILAASSCAGGKTMCLSHNPDIVILDLGLPDADGLEFIKYIRQKSATPVIVLSARTDERDKVAALDMGANDYVTKPFNTAELLARIRAALRSKRYNFADSQFQLHDMLINYDRRDVYINGNPVALTQTEYNITALLSRHPGKVLTYATIIKEIWGYADTGSIKRLQVNMANIRKKLDIKPGEKKYIVNELGVGYRMCDENE